MKIGIRLIYCSFALITYFGCNLKNTDKSFTLSETDKKELRHIKEVEWPKAYAEQDTSLLDKILGEDFKMIDVAGNWYGKEDELDWIKKNATKNDAFNYEIKRFDILENGTAIICGTGHILKDSVNSIYQSSNVFVKRDGTWKAVLSHVSGFKNVEKE
jgi:hypothetical protein